MRVWYGRVVETGWLLSQVRCYLGRKLANLREGVKGLEMLLLVLVDTSMSSYPHTISCFECGRSLTLPWTNLLPQRMQVEKSLLV